ncbi:uncharacterized protein Z518_10252 [Rhinocladiella mackenziei CBS 650.93]|uniref:Rhinocladiella mackenziei CBS 650.93 unplaced genomic scaffold supercont1.9, whole genome shotgun sequence n=1 Tax=Rhinocladiella mackenziei CBS 650.93 TaxID=1442369 RepID=A0A0D2ITR2_9EURO|nr:uncharacterized protein Z518_10252 [Rhinocladiella mackenziei CBS 650.93]KIX00115.1 hypothetical protein Z518_10252 [Rhinocladiella mackenziei CBS 650.93]
MTAAQILKVVIKNVHVFDGEQMQDGGTVAFDKGVLVGESSDADVVIDGQDGYLLPGLIDCHVHVHSHEDLSSLAQHGVTTALDMGTRTLDVFERLRGGRGICDVRSSGMPATSPGSRHSKIPGFPAHLLVTRVDEAQHFVSDRVGEGADYLKVMVDNPGPDQEILNALVLATHEQGRMIIAHATSCESFSMALAAGVDILTHVPMENPLSSHLVTQMKSKGCISVPTLIKMLATANKNPGPPNDYNNARMSVIDLKCAQVPILAGTDANKHGSGPGKVPCGESIFQELELLVEAGLSPLEAVRSATALPSSIFGLEDRGSIEVGKRADLILVAANPLENISNIRQVQRVWCGGMQVAKDPPK